MSKHHTIEKKWNLPVPGKFGHQNVRDDDLLDMEYAWLIHKSDYNRLKVDKQGEEFSNSTEERYDGQRFQLRNSKFLSQNNNSNHSKTGSFVLSNNGHGNEHYAKQSFEIKTTDPDVSTNFKSGFNGKKSYDDVDSEVSGQKNKRNSRRDVEMKQSGLESDAKEKNKKQEMVTKEVEVLVGNGSTRSKKNQEEMEKKKLDVIEREKDSVKNEEENKNEEDNKKSEVCRKISESSEKMKKNCRRLFDKRVSICPVPMNDQFSKNKTIKVDELYVKLHFYDDVSDLLLTCQLAAIVEVINPLVGIVKTGVTAPFLQVFGRNFVLFVLIVPVKQFHEDTTVFMLFLAWSAVEIIRYPFYILTLHRCSNKFIEWLRYSAWIILYPVGFTCELLVLYRSIWISMESKRWEYPLPNVLNISISLASLIIFYMCAFTPGSLYLMKHMWILRQRKLGGKKKFKRQ